MNQQEFNQLSGDLIRLSGLIPLHWGNIQNDATDSQINMFQIHSFEELERQLAPLTEASRNYFRRRWFLWKCAQCEEYLFYVNPNVTPNPNPRDQSYDVEINGNASLRFDIKGTVIPRQFRNDVEGIIRNPLPMINFFYEEQSRGVRKNIQNRLFVIHHSYVNQGREMMLRCKFDLKQTVYSDYCRRVSINANFLSFDNAIADIIYIFENLDGSFSSRLHSI